MRVMLVIDHPWPESFNHQMLAAAVRGLEAAGHQADVLDLHLDGFDPVMHVEDLEVYRFGQSRDPKVKGYQDRLLAAQHLALIFPVWWEVMPAMLKGFFDKVLLPDWAFREVDFSPLLTHFTGATVLTTMGAPEAIHTSVEAALCRGTLEAVGIRPAQWINYLAVSTVSQGRRDQWLREIEAMFRAF